MSFFFKRKKPQKQLQQIIPSRGLEEVLKSKFILDQLKVRLSAAQLPGWGVREELKCQICNSKRVEETSKYQDGFKVFSNCVCKECGHKWKQESGRESEASEMFRYDTIASFFHGEIGEVFKMSPQAHKAYSRLYRKLLHAEETYGKEHKYTCTIRKALFYAFTLCLHRCVRKEHTTPQVVGMPPEMSMPWMRGGYSGFFDDLGLVKPGAIKPKDEEILDDKEDEE